MIGFWFSFRRGDISFTILCMFLLETTFQESASLNLSLLAMLPLPEDFYTGQIGCKFLSTKCNLVSWAVHRTFWNIGNRKCFFSYIYFLRFILCLLALSFYPSLLPEAIYHRPPLSPHHILRPPKSVSQSQGACFFMKYGT